MKKNTITIDLEKVYNFPTCLHDENGIQIGYLPDILKLAQVPERCTLTQAVEKFGKVFIDGSLGEHLTTPGDVEQFKAEYLNKEETLEDGIYRYGEGGDLCFVKNGKSYANSWAVENNAPFKRADDLINPVKIAEI